MSFKSFKTFKCIHFRSSYKSSKLIYLICLFFQLIQSISCIQVYYLNETEINGFNVLDRKVIICKTIQEKKWLNLFAKSYLKINNVEAIKNIHNGFDVAEVSEKMSKWFNYNYLRMFLNSSTINLPLYIDHCVGIESTSNYSLTYQFDSFDLSNFLLFIVGIILFYSSNNLSKKIYIYYASYVSIGVIGSLLILTIFMHRFLPKKIYAFFVLSGFYFNTYFLVKIKEYLFTYPIGLYLACYILVAAVISFSFAYSKGPIKNHRIFDLFKWGLQFISLIIIFISSELTELITFIMIIMLLKYNIPSIGPIKDKLIKYYRYYYPEPRKLLTLKEYEKEAQFNTEQELEKLRSFCQSPEFNKWRAMKKMHNASRFAGFIDGEDHVSDSEVFEHLSHTSFIESHWTDDESDESIGIDD